MAERYAQADKDRDEQDKPGEKMQVINYADRIEFVPIRKIKNMRGFLKGINTTVVREKDRI